MSWKNGILISWLLVLIACHPGQLDPAGLIKWVDDPDNGLRLIQKVKEFELELLYRPPCYTAAKEYLNSGQRANMDVYKRIEELKELQYFSLRFTTDEKELNLKDYLRGQIQKDLKLVEGSDTLSCQVFHYEDNHGLAPYFTCLLGFIGTNEGTDKKLLYNGNDLGIGNIEFTIANKSLENIPDLILR